jgi:beta-lactamase superfamily II metal-dependent hydrolase
MRRCLALASLLLWIAASVGAQQQPPSELLPPPLRIHFVDVGQGDAILLQAPTGQTMVYDAGGDPLRMAGYLSNLGITQVGLVIASHNHADHIGGLPELVRRTTPLYYMDSGVAAATLVQAQVFDAVAAAGSALLEPIARRITMGDVTLTVVPPPGIRRWDQNDNSIGLVVEYGRFRLSLAGDAEPREWAWWAVNQPAWLAPVDVHKASHHGSVNGDTAAAIGALSPDVVVIGVGRDNVYGHPDPSALRLYAEAGATVYRTDLNGTVVIEVDAAGSYTVHAERGEGARPPPAAVAPPAIAPILPSATPMSSWHR